MIRASIVSRIIFALGRRIERVGWKLKRRGLALDKRPDPGPALGEAFRREFFGPMEDAIRETGWLTGWSVDERDPWEQDTDAWKDDD